MGFLTKLFSSTITSAVDAVGNAIDKNTTTDDERAQNAIVMERLRQNPAALQVELNKVEAQHRSTFVAGWRPAIGWCCAIGLFYDFLLMPSANGLGASFVAIDTTALHSLIIALLGLSSLRTFEKFGGKTK